MIESTSLRTFVGSVVCIDLVGYSKLPVDQQISVKKRFNTRLMKALARVPAKDRILLDTGDGVLIGFLGDPDECFTTVLNIRDVLEPGTARIGIHLGSVKLLPGVSGDVRLVGDTASIAERITAFAQPGQIVASRSLHAMVSRLSDQHGALFRNGGVHTDKHGEEHEIFVVSVQPPKPSLVKPFAFAVAGVVALAAIGIATWYIARRISAPSAAPQVASNAEPARTAEAKREEPPPVVGARKAESPPAVASRSEPVSEPKKSRAPRSEPASSSSPSSDSRSQSSQPASVATEGQKFLSALTGAARDAARTVGTTTQGVYSTAKDKIVGTTQPATPPPTLVSRSSTYFPLEAANQGIQRGKVRARLDIDASGTVTRVTILSADPPEMFDREATRSLRLWRFNIGADGRTYETEVDFKR